MTYGIEHPDPGLGQSSEGGGVKSVNGIPSLPNPHCKVLNLSDLYIFRFPETMPFSVLFFF